MEVSETTTGQNVQKSSSSQSESVNEVSFDFFSFFRLNQFLKSFNFNRNYEMIWLEVWINCRIN